MVSAKRCIESYAFLLWQQPQLPLQVGFPRSVASSSCLQWSISDIPACNRRTAGSAGDTFAWQTMHTAVTQLFKFCACWKRSKNRGNVCGLSLQVIEAMMAMQTHS